MDSATLNKIRDERLRQQSAQVDAARHNELVTSTARTQESILQATRSLITYLEGHTTKAEVVNQLTSIGTPDALKVIPYLEALHTTLKTHKNTDLSGVTKLMQELVAEAKLIPKELPEAKEVVTIDYTKQLEGLGEAIRAVEGVIKQQELVAEAPVVNVAAPNVKVDAPDLGPLQTSIGDVVTAVNKIVIPEPDTKEVEKLIKVSNRLLKELLEKPVAAGGGGGGRVSPYQDAAGMPTFVELNTDGSVPIGGQLMPKSFDAISIPSYDTNGNPLTVQYYQGGLSGTLVATLTMTYVGDNVSTVERS